jgi:outer membrane protein
MKKILAGLLLLCCQYSKGQSVTLFDFMKLARTGSYTIQSANADKTLAGLSFNSFKLSGRPLLAFNGNVPTYNKDNYAVTQPDGSIKFLPRSQNYSNLGLGFSQPLLFSGGTLSINTDLYRFDNFTARTKQYNGTPVFVRLSQPLFKYNIYKRDKQIAPLKLQEADQAYKTAQLQMEYEVCRLFFAVIAAQEDERLAIANLENGTANFVIEQRRVQLGVSTEDKVLGLEIQQINARQQQAAAALNIRKSFAALNNYINSADTSIKKMQIPQVLPVALPDKSAAIEQAKKNLPQYIAFQRKRKEAQEKLAEAKMQGRQMDISASYGLNNSAAELATIYQNSQYQQRFSIGFNIPITDWGKRKNNVTIVKAEQEQTEILIKQEEAKLLLEISSLADELPVLKNNVSQALMLDTLALKRYMITNRLFQSGKTSLLEQQAAQTEKDNARKNYIAALQRFWEAWYLLKAKTLAE